jgi:hypothetical protein
VKRDCQRSKEKKRYVYNINILWNSKVYTNEDTMLYWIKYIYQFSSAYSTISVEQEPCFLSFDAFTAHLTSAVCCALTAQKTTISIVPDSCTRIVQVLDVSLNKLLKDLIKEEQDNHFDCYIDK